MMEGFNMKSDQKHVVSAFTCTRLIYPSTLVINKKLSYRRGTARRTLSVTQSYWK